MTASGEPESIEDGFKLQELGKNERGLGRMNAVSGVQVSHREKGCEAGNKMASFRCDSTKSILIVDDDPSIVNTFKMILEIEGYSVYTANRALSAAEKASKIHFDLVIMDMNLPDTSGDELVANLRAINDKTNILMVSGKRGLHESQDLRDVRVLMKPVDPEELVLTTRKILQED